MADLRDLEDWAAPLLAKLQPAERRKLARTIARELRRQQSQRIAAQKSPDGTPFEPRKPQARHQRGAIRRQAMFSKIRQAKRLRIKGQPDGAEVGFIGRIARIARVHQYGLRDRVESGGPEYHYPQRELLGFSDDGRRLVRDLLIDHFT